MPTKLPQDKRCFLAAAFWTCVAVPLIYGIVAYHVIEHEQLRRASINSRTSIVTATPFLIRHQ